MMKLNSVPAGTNVLKALFKVRICSAVSKEQVIAERKTDPSFGKHSTLLGVRMYEYSRNIVPYASGFQKGKSTMTFPF